jgi:hypothetical protein
MTSSPRKSSTVCSMPGLATSPGRWDGVLPEKCQWFADFVQELCSYHEKAKYKDRVDAGDRKPV